MEGILSFINESLCNSIHHRNQLKHFRSVIHSLLEQFNALWIDVENLKVPVKKEPWLLHWYHKQVTVHSGIAKVNEHNVYYPYLSSDRDHDQQVVATAINKILQHSNNMIKDEIEPNLMIIESDNAVQYKYDEHFHAMQKTL